MVASIADVNKQFARLQSRVQNRISLAAEKAVAKVAQQEAKSALIGVGSGALRRSIGVSSGRTRGRRVTYVGIRRRKTVSKNVNEYAAIQEFGGTVAVKGKKKVRIVYRKYTGKGFLQHGRRLALARGGTIVAEAVDKAVRRELAKS